MLSFTRYSPAHAALPHGWLARSFTLILIWLLLSAVPRICRASGPQNGAAPQNFIFFGMEHQRIAEASFLDNTNIVGAELKYTWRQLEPARDHYDFRGLTNDLAQLQRRHKRLFVQLQDVTFSEDIPVPDYLLKDPEFHGGAARKYEGDGGKATFDGWVARRWDPAVRERFRRLLDALGREADGRIEGIALPETAISFGEKTNRHPAGFTYETYVEGVKDNLAAARHAFPRSCVIEYANFMPGEWLPWTDHGYLKAVYQYAEKIGAGVGGPDLLPHRKGQLSHSLPLIAARNPSTPAGLAVQDGNLSAKNPSTGKRVTVDELYHYAKDHLRLTYIFWGTEEPYYTRDVLPYISRLGSSSSR